MRGNNDFGLFVFACNTDFHVTKFLDEIYKKEVLDLFLYYTVKHASENQEGKRD